MANTVPQEMLMVWRLVATVLDDPMALLEAPPPSIKSPTQSLPITPYSPGSGVWILT